MMRQTSKHIFIAFALICSVQATFGQSILPTATYKDENDEEQTMEPGGSYTGSAPIEVSFDAGLSDVGNYIPHFEWHFYEGSDTENPYLIRYDETTQYTFTKAGVQHVSLTVSLVNGTDTILFTPEDFPPFEFSISESKLEFPNAFSPNGDGVNDIYKAKSTYQSIVEFKATIFNRWGQKIFTWENPAEGWDGTFHGKPVKDGVYFVNVDAKGADGRHFRIRKAVNLLRSFNEAAGTVTE